MLILLLHPHHRHLPRIIHPRHSILSSLSSGNDHHPQALRAFPASVLVPRRIRIHRKSSQVILRLPVLLRCRHPSKEKHSNQPAVRMPAQRHIQPAPVKSIIPDHRFRIMACQNIDAIHLSQFTHKHLFKVSPVIMPRDPAKIYRSTALGSKADNLDLQSHCSQTGQCLIQSSIYIGIFLLTSCSWLPS